MTPFADLLERLAFSPSRHAKLKLLADYLATTPSPDRGWALAALTDGLPVAVPFRRTLRELVAGRVDAELYQMSRDYVGDTAETVALIWPDGCGSSAPPPTLSEVVAVLATGPREMLAACIEGWLDSLDANGRWALLKLLYGAPRVGVSARLAKTALAQMSGIGIEEIEEVWHAQSPPYDALFDWLGGGPKPDISDRPVFRPLMLSHPLDDGDAERLDISGMAIEWKWDGIRVQIACSAAGTRLYSRNGEDIGRSFPDIVEGWSAAGVFDGELLVVRDGAVAPFSDLQQRLNRKSVSRQLLLRHPAHVRLYDALMIGAEDLRPLPFIERRRRLELWHGAAAPARTDLSALIEVQDRTELMRIWSGTRAAGIEGLMLKRLDGPYLAGRPKGHWFKWKREPLTADCVLMYAQRGSGKRSSFHSDFTFGAWSSDPDGTAKLVPVGKAYSGFTDAELVELDRWVRQHTAERFGPVRRVVPELVLEVAFDAVQRSSRHRSGIAMRFPRIHRIRWDKPAAEADRLEQLEALIER